MKTKIIDMFSEMLHVKKYTLEKSVNLILPDLPE